MTSHIRRLPGRFPLTLIPSLDTETPVAHPAALPLDEVAPVQFTADGDFNDHPKTWNLPDSAVALWTRAGEWSGHNTQYGFVPADMLARFCSDPVQAVGVLLSRGLWRRVKGGYQFCEWERVGVTAEQAERKRLDAAERQRRSRANRKAAQADQTQTPAVTVTPMSHVTSRDTPQIDRSDLDQSSSGVGHINAQTRESPAVIAAVIKAVAAKVERIISAAEADRVIAKIRARPKTPKKIHDPVKYFTVAIENEKDLYAELLCAPAEVLEAALPEPDPNRPDIERHAYERDPRTGVCKCDRPKSNWRHEPQEEAIPA